ncbi:hypothetical protein [Streptomyces synnematoformans]|uniref:Uncharacterized protein n=1 Tax=Streptomyces synnematoformans TaxID=415721 RepID=A0ABN2Z441_9ACTN
MRAQIILDIIACCARSAALIGDRIMSLIHSNDPDIDFEPVGALPVMWNAAEWHHARRDPDTA